MSDAARGIRMRTFLAILYSAGMVAAGVLPWTEFTYDGSRVPINAGLLHEYLPIYTIGTGVVVLLAAVSSSRSLRQWIATSTGLSVAISFYFGSQLKQTYDSIVGVASIFGYGDEANAFIGNAGNHFSLGVGLVGWFSAILIGVLFMFAYRH